MKKNIYASLLAGVVLFSACSDDRDSNPTVLQPDSFELNMPALGGNTYDLESTTSIDLTYKQPDYGYTAPVTYYVQVSVNNTWNEATSAEEEDATYIELDGSVNECAFSAAATQINRAIMKLENYTDASQLPVDPMTLYVRMKAELHSGYECFSNVLELSVRPYFAALIAADPELWYLIGGCIGDGSWGTGIGTAVMPMSPVEGFKYDEITGQGELVYTGYFLNSQGFKIVKVPGAWDEQWGGENNDITKPYKKDAAGEGGDFKVPADGYYHITLNTKSNTLSIVATEAPKYSYEHLMIAGEFNDWATDMQMRPVNTVEGVINHNWTFELDITDDDMTVKILYDNWTPNWGGTGFPFGFGVNGGANIPVAVGSYIVIFNDIDGYYHFFSK